MNNINSLCSQTVEDPLEAIMDAPSRMKVYVDTPYWFIRPNNTDWRYMRYLKHIESICPVQFIYPFDLLDVISQSYTYLAGKRFFPQFLALDIEARKLKYNRLSVLGVDLIINHGVPPLLDSGNIPIIWHYAVIDPAMQRYFGKSENDIERQVDFFERMLPRASVVQVATQAESRRHCEMFPRAAGKFYDAPFFLPHVSPMELDEIRTKQGTPDVIEILFVGSEGRRKGLDILCAAIRSLDEDMRRRTRLTVVSKEIEQEWLCGVVAETHFSKSVCEVRELMRRSHIFAMPSRLESFGFVFVEAMAAGCAVIAPDWEVQREITDNGRAGLCVRPEIRDVQKALVSLVSIDEMRTRIAISGRQRYEERYSMKAVAQKYMSMFERTLSERSRRPHGIGSV